MRIVKAIYILLFCFCCFLVYPQQKYEAPLEIGYGESGTPLITNYSPDDYRAFTQNWGATQDDLGRMYFANGDGVLIYDGVEWQLVPVSNSSAIFVLEVDEEGVVYVGAQNELGFVAPNKSNAPSYISLLDKLPEAQRKFDRVNHIGVSSEGIYFCTDKFVARWNGTKFKIWSLDCADRMISFSIGATLYINCIEKGMMKLVDDKFEFIENGKFLADKKVYSLLKYDKDRLLVCTQNSLFIYDGRTFEPFQTSDPAFFEDNIIYKSLKLQNGDFALGSLYKGILIIDAEGIRQNVLSEETGLPTNQVLGLFQDHSGLLWVSLFSGISKIEYPSSFSYYSNTAETPKLVYDIIRFKEKIYVGGPDGLFALEAASGLSNGKLVSVGKEVGMVWDLLEFENRMIVGGIGMHEVNSKGVVTKLNELITPIMFRSELDSNRVFLGLSPGLTSIRLNNGKWIREKNYPEVEFEVAKLKEDMEGNLWLGTYNSALAKISFENRQGATRLENHQFKIYDSKDGMPEDIGHPLIIEDQVYFVASNGDTYLYDPNNDRFEMDRFIYKDLGLDELNVRLNTSDSEENIWILEKDSDNRVVGQYLAQRRLGGKYQTTKIDARRIKDYRRGALVGELKDSIIWYRGKSGIIRHDIRRKTAIKDIVSNVLITKLFYKQDSVLFAGFGISDGTRISFKQNELRFQFASTTYYDEHENEFQYQLYGYDEEWSKWSKETQKDYTNIPEGDYSFKVRAKNIYGKISEEVGYSFTILAPWYRSWLAYLCYALLGILALWIFAQWRSRQLQNKNLALEALVDERTEEIREKNKLLGHQTERLKEMDTMKTRLFANISHEFRTPLTLIKGPIEKLESAGGNKISTPNIKMIRRNSNRLLNLVNQLLDLSKLDSGKLKLNLAEGDVFKCIRAAASSFSSHAASRQMDYQIKISPRLLWASFDRDKFEKIIYNLLSNAFKFTSDEGRVIIEAEFRNGRIKMKLSDTGCGITSDKLPHIFDRFFQVDDSYTKEKAGSGIGLALTKELVELMGGTIFVESEPSKGTLFRVVLPLEEIQSGKIHEEVEEVSTTIITVDSEQSSATTFKSKEVKILIIEDNNDMRHFIREQLETDYAVFEAVNGKEGLKLANKMMPDLIVTDLMMPQMDGITLCKKLKTDLATCHIPVIMLTAKAGIENKLEGLETGADDYLTKPFNAKELQIRTKNLIASRQHLRELFSRNISLDPKEITVTSLDEKFLQQVLALLEQKYSDSEFGVPQMQKDLGMSKTSLHSKIKALTNHPPGELLRNFRLQRAAQLLTQQADNISQVAYDVGFNSLSYFTRCFKEYYGISPSKFLKNR